MKGGTLEDIIIRTPEALHFFSVLWGAISLLGLLFSVGFYVKAFDQQNFNGWWVALWLFLVTVTWSLVYILAPFSVLD